MYIETDNSFFHRDLVKIYYGGIPPKWEVHHVDGNKNNNNHTNLLPCPSSLHRYFHSCKMTRVDMIKAILDSEEGKKYCQYPQYDMLFQRLKRILVVAKFATTQK